jgi:hypothetical protein
LADPRTQQWQAGHWHNGQLVMPGLASLALPALAVRAHASNRATGAMPHAFSRLAWSQATSTVSGQEWTANIDALAVRSGADKYVRFEHTAIKFAPTDFNRIGTAFSSGCGTLVRVESWTPGQA